MPRGTQENFWSILANTIGNTLQSAPSVYGAFAQQKQKQAEQTEDRTWDRMMQSRQLELQQAQEQRMTEYYDTLAKNMEAQRQAELVDKLQQGWSQKFAPSPEQNFAYQYSGTSLKDIPDAKLGVFAPELIRAKYPETYGYGTGGGKTPATITTATWLKENYGEEVANAFIQKLVGNPIVGDEDTFRAKVTTFTTLLKGYMQSDEFTPDSAVTKAMTDAGLITGQLNPTTSDTDITDAISNDPDFQAFKRMLGGNQSARR